MKSLVYGKLQSVFVFVCQDRPFHESEWDEYIRFLRANLKPGMEPKCIVITEGGGPSASQRQQLNETVAPFRNVLKVAVMTSSPLARGIVTALSWFNPGFRAFVPGDVESALGYLGIPRTAQAEVKSMVANLRMQLAS